MSGRKRGGSTRSAGVIGVLLLLGCGGRTRASAEVAAECSEGRPCGGDPSGAWLATDVCTSLDFIEAAILDCEVAEVLAEQPLVSGVASWEPEGTYLASLVRSGSAEFRIPEACVAPATRSGDCDEFADLLLLRGEHLLELVQCERRGAACDCLVELRPVEQSLFGYWSAPPGLRVDVDVSPYCVRNDTLWLFTGSGTTAGETFGFRRR